MALPKYYGTGTASVANGATSVTGTGTAWAAIIKADDRFTVQGLSVRIASVEGNGALTLAEAWPGTSLTDDPYEIATTYDGPEFQLRSRELIEQLKHVYGLTPSAPPVDELADRAEYDDEDEGFIVLVNDYDGEGSAGFYVMGAGGSGDWSSVTRLTGPKGDAGDPGEQGESGLIGEWKGPWVTATDYALNDAVAEGGSSYMCVEAHTSGTFATDLAAEKWEIAAQKGADGTDGLDGSDGADGADGADGISFIWRGAYSGATAYAANDVVEDNGSAWIALQATTGNAPPALPTTANTWWELLARRGTDGAGTVAGVTAGAGISVDSTDPANPEVSLDADADDIDDSSTTHKFATAAELSKLAGIEAGATADQDAEDVPFTPAGNLAATNVQGALEELDSEKQPLDSDLTAIAALTTTSYGRALLELVNQAALMALLDVADATAVRAATSGKLVDADGVLSAMDWVSLTDAGTISVDHAAGVNRKVTLGGNRAFGAPSNGKVGWPLNIWIVQDGTGSRVPTWDSAYDFGDAGTPTLSTGANQADLVTFICLTASKFAFLGIRKRVD